MSDTQNPTPGNENPDMVKLKVVGQDSNSIYYRVKWSTRMEKLKRSYSTRMGAPLDSLRFLFDGKRVQDDDTPKQLEMEDDDTIEVYQEQTGGNVSTIKFNHVQI